MIAVWYDDACDQIWISGATTSYAPGSLVAVRDGDNLGVRMRSGTEFLVYSPFDALTDRAGVGFLSAVEAQAYLVGVFSRRPVQGLTFTQSLPAAVWTIPHGLGFNPNVSLIDTTGDSLLADLAWPDAATVLVRFGAPTAGTAYLS